MRKCLTIGLLLGLSAPAWAEGTVQIVVPNRPDVPIIINGIDASYAVIEGDYGLARGVRMQPTIYGGRLVDPEPDVGHYFPSNGVTPRTGRLEIEPRRRRPQQAESYYRSWGAQSAPPAINGAPPPIAGGAYPGPGDLPVSPRY
jgi:hypothetical protein